MIKSIIRLKNLIRNNDYDLLNKTSKKKYRKYNNFFYKEDILDKDLDYHINIYNLSKLIKKINNNQDTIYLILEEEKHKFNYFLSQTKNISNENLTTIKINVDINEQDINRILLEINLLINFTDIKHITIISDKKDKFIPLINKIEEIQRIDKYIDIKTLFRNLLQKFILRINKNIIIKSLSISAIIIIVFYLSAKYYYNNNYKKYEQTLKQEYKQLNIKKLKNKKIIDTLNKKAKNLQQIKGFSLSQNIKIYKK